MRRNFLLEDAKHRVLASQWPRRPARPLQSRQILKLLRPRVANYRVVQRAFAVLVAVAALTACSSEPCEKYRVVRATSPPPGATIGELRPGTDGEDIELDDGHVYRGAFSTVPNTGAEVTLCQVRSKIDGSTHYSLRYGGSENVERVR
jgi:hypothetical protein